MPFPAEHRPDQTSWASLAHASGAIVATTWDVARFTRALFTGEILPEPVVAEMAVFRDVSSDEVVWTGQGMGCGRYVIDGTEYWGHEGLFIGFQGCALHCPQRGYQLAVLGNVSRFDTAAVVASLADEIEARL